LIDTSKWGTLNGAAFNEEEFNAPDPPVLTWGPVDGNVASEEMTVLYSLVGTPGVAWAELELMDGRVLSMTVASDRLTVLLPSDAPEGAATVRAYFRDDQFESLVTTISGVLPPAPEPTPTGGGMPQFVREPEPFVVRFHSSLTVRASYRQRVSHTERPTVQVRVRYTLGGGRKFEERVRLTAQWRVSTTQRGTVALSTAEETAVHRRGEGPGTEESLILAGVL
jgi:hypothetical protein